MNVIFLDFDGVIYTIHRNSLVDIENRIKILSEICKKYNAKVVISSARKDNIDEDTLTTSDESINNLFLLFKKYNIEVIGRTPTICLDLGNNIFIDSCKELEINEYLSKHSEIKKYVIIDDDDKNSDLKSFQDYVVKPIIYSSNNYDEEGLLPKHIDEVGEVFDMQNKIR